MRVILLLVYKMRVHDVGILLLHLKHLLIKCLLKIVVKLIIDIGWLLHILSLIYRCESHAASCV
jgi:hypothetical protein